MNKFFTLLDPARKGTYLLSRVFRMISFISDRRTILILSAILPSLALLCTALGKRDGRERIPFLSVLFLLLLGILSTFPALLLEKAGSAILPLFLREGTRLYAAVFFYAVVALGEEGMKLFFLRKGSWNSRHLTSVFSALIFSLSLSMGFALWENIAYVLSSGFSTALLRALTAVPGHASFSVFMGLWYGLEKRADERGWRIRALIFRTLSLLFPVLLHGTYDYLASGAAGERGLITFLLFTASLFLVSWKTLSFGGRNEKKNPTRG